MTNGNGKEKDGIDSNSPVRTFLYQAMEAFRCVVAHRTHRIFHFLIARFVLWFWPNANTNI